MKSDVSITNESFDFLRNSPEFLNLILNNISSCILLLDKDIRLKAYNDSLKTIFSSKKDEDLMYMKCGEAIGCAYQIEEQIECGKTSQCHRCDLRIAALKSYANNETIYKDQVTKPFFTHDNKKVEKNLQFSTRLFHYKKEEYIIMIIDDVSRLVEKTKGSSILTQKVKQNETI